MSVITLNNENFKEEVLDSKIPVLIDFWATWCGPCKMMLPIVDEIAEDKKNEIKVCKVNLDEAPEIAEKYQVMSIPTFLVIKNGEETNRAMGVKTKEEIIKMI